MNFEKKVPEWKAEGTEPPSSLKTSGFQAGYRPPASYFNWFWNKVSACLTELQTKLSNVDNTADADKSVKYASTSGKADKVKSSMIVRLNGGSTEGTNQFTFDGSAGKSVNITADQIGAAKKDGKSTIIAATSTDGIAYTATMDGITELFDGLKITIIPNIISASTAVTLDLNGLGAKRVRLTLPFNSSNAGATPSLPTWMGAGSPLTLTYHSRFNTWKTDLQMASGSDLYGKVPIQGGGTYANSETTEADKAKARQDLGIESANGAVVSGGSDYAICFAWQDGNPNKENRKGYFVQLADGGDKIAIATATSDVCGIVTDSAAFVENYDIATEYTDFVGILGIVTAVDDGTCEVGGTCMPNANGIATKSSNNMGYRVMGRVDSTHIKVAVKPNDDMIQRIRTDVGALQTHAADTTKHITDTERNSWNSKAAGSHTHDDRYYTESEVDTKLATKQDAATAIHTGNIAAQSVNYASIAMYAHGGAGLTTASLRNEYFASTDTTPSVNGQICWTYG